MATSPDLGLIALYDSQLAKWSTQLHADDIDVQVYARKRINYWLDKRLRRMREEEQRCGDSQHSASVRS